MKKLIAALTVLVAASHAQADGFVCHSEEAGLNVKVFNHVQPELGTRNPARMIVSDADVTYGRKTIAVFTSEKGTIASYSTNDLTVFVGKVDLRVRESNRGGEYLVGTRLAHVDEIRLYVGFNYGDNLFDGEAVPGFVQVVLRNGESVTAEAECVRYLKN